MKNINKIQKIAYMILALLVVILIFESVYLLVVRNNTTFSKEVKETISTSMQQVKDYRVEIYGIKKEYQFDVIADIKGKSIVNEISSDKVVYEAGEDKRKKLYTHHDLFFDTENEQLRLSTKIGTAETTERILSKKDDANFQIGPIDSTRILSYFGTLFVKKDWKKQGIRYYATTNSKETQELISLIQFLTLGEYNDMLDRKDTIQLYYKLDTNQEYIESVELKLNETEGTVTFYFYDFQF